MNNIQIFSILTVLFVCALLVFMLVIKSGKYEAFSVFINEFIVPTECYNYLVTNGSKYYLLNTKRIYDGVTNPLEFNTVDAAYAYLDKSGCPRLDLIDLVVRKNIEDPQESQERICAKIVAPNIFNKNVCADYAVPWDASPAVLGNDVGKRGVWDSVALKLGLTPNDKIAFNKVATDGGRDLNLMTGAEIMAFARINKLKIEDATDFSNFDIEKCMINMTAKNIPGLDDPKFKQRFEQYFSHLSQGIPEELLITV